MPLIDSQNKVLKSTKGRIILGILIIAIVAIGCFVLLKTSNDVQSKLDIIPSTKDHLISYSSISKESFEKYTLMIDQVIHNYKLGGGNIYDCDDDNPPKDGQACDIDLRKFKPCVEENYYSYHRSSPCVFLKIKKTLHWEPKYLNSSDLPEKMPQYLKSFISSVENINKKAVWVTCEGENDIDKENVGPMKFYPSFGFPYYYFPYNNQKDYLEPIVAVHFERPARGVAIFVKCRIWTQDSNDSTIFALQLQ